MLLDRKSEMKLSSRFVLLPNSTADESKHQENELESTSSNDQLLSKMIEDGKLYGKQIFISNLSKFLQTCD